MQRQEHRSGEGGKHGDGSIEDGRVVGAERRDDAVEQVGEHVVLAHHPTADGVRALVRRLRVPRRKLLRRDERNHIQLADERAEVRMRDRRVVEVRGERVDEERHERVERDVPAQRLEARVRPVEHLDAQQRGDLLDDIRHERRLDVEVAVQRGDVLRHAAEVLAEARKPRALEVRRRAPADERVALDKRDERRLKARVALADEEVDEVVAPGKQRVERLEGVDDLCETRFRRAGKTILEISKIEHVNFRSVHAAVEPACGQGERAVRLATEVQEQTHRLPVLFDNVTEHRSELDVNQIGKYLQREHHLTLSEEVIKTTATRRSWRTQKGLAREFVAFDRVIETNLPEFEPQRPLHHAAALPDRPPDRQGRRKRPSNSPP